MGAKYHDASPSYPGLPKVRRPPRSASAPCTSRSRPPQAFSRNSACRREERKDRTACPSSTSRVRRLRLASVAHILNLPMAVPLGSPLIEYGGTWNNYIPVQPLAELMSPDFNTDSGDRMFGVSFTFNGTGVAISGSRSTEVPVRHASPVLSHSIPTAMLTPSAHGQCNMSVTLDGSTQLVSLELGKFGGGASYDEVFFAQKDLDARATHQLSMNIPVMTNRNSSQSCVSLGLQFVNITAGDGHMKYVVSLLAMITPHWHNRSTYMNNTVLDLNSGNITYDPPAAWSTLDRTSDGVAVSKYGLHVQLFASLGLTLHGHRSTRVNDSTVEFVFQGEGSECIEVFSADFHRQRDRCVWASDAVAVWTVQCRSRRCAVCVECIL
jgi:hypothetical protein